MKIKQLFKKRDRLQSELNKVIKEIETRKLIGYRVYLHGDEYDYGTYQDFLLKDYNNKSEAREQAELLSDKGKNGGLIIQLFPWNRKPPERVH